MKLTAIKSKKYAGFEQLEAIKEAHSNGVIQTLPEHCCNHAIVAGDVKTLEYFHKNGAKLNKTASILAAEHDKLECLLYTMQAGCIKNRRILYASVKGGSYDCLNYIKNNGLYKNNWSGVFRNVCKKGEIELLKYVVEEMKYYKASIIFDMMSLCARGHLECVKYICEKWPEEVYDACWDCWMCCNELIDVANKYGQKEIEEYLTKGLEKYNSLRS